MLNLVEIEAYLDLAGDNFGFIEEDIDIKPFEEDLMIYKKEKEKLLNEAYEKYGDSINKNILEEHHIFRKNKFYCEEKHKNIELFDDIEKLRIEHKKNKEKVRCRRRNSTQNILKRKLKNNYRINRIYIAYNQFGQLTYYRYNKSTGQNSRASYLLKQSNKRIRRLPLKDTPNNGAHYRKCYDYWWILY